MIEDEVLRVERRLGVALAVWGAGSTAVGGLLSWRGKNAATRAFGRQTAGWGFVDGVIAAVAHFRNRNRTEAPDEEDAIRLRRVLLVNTLLDVGYVAGGILLLTQASRLAKVIRWPKNYGSSELRGDGLAVVIQGGFLFIIDSAALRELQ